MTHTGFEYLSSCELTHRGHFRQQNEDAILRLPEYGVFCVADGMGGHERGALASSRAVEILQHEFVNSRSLCFYSAVSSGKHMVSKAFNRASRWIKTHAASEGLSTVGTTTVVLLFDRRSPCRAHVFHAGDSRAYLFRSGGISRLTRDHTVAEAAGFRDDREVPPFLRGVITRAVGIDFKVILEETPTDVQPDDIFMLCSDGLTRMVDEPEMETIFRANNGTNLEQLADVLVQEALCAGGTDNISVVLVRVGQHSQSGIVSCQAPACV